MQNQISKIIGIVLSLSLLLSQAPIAHALYSPALSEMAKEIKQDIVRARQQNGVGSWLNAWEKVSQDNAKNKKQGKATGTPGLYTLRNNAVTEIMIQSVSGPLGDGIIILLFPWLSGRTSCLRDDIWELQALQEEVLNEMFKSSLLGDVVNGGTLQEDYGILQVTIDGNVEKNIPGLKNDWKDTAYWFPNSNTNYYVKCSSGAVPQALDEAWKSLKRVADTFSGGGFQLGSISQMWSIAKQRAVKRAADYIAKNQIKVSLGGSPGANPQGLFNGNGLAGLAASLKTAWNTSVIGYYSQKAATPEKPKKNNEELSKVLRDYQTAQKTITQDLNRISNALTFSIQLNHVSEQSLKAIEADMVNINTVIRQGTNQNSIPKICEELFIVLNSQCKNKSAARNFSCKN